MTVDEFRERLNLCIEVYNKNYQKIQAFNPDQEMVMKISEKLETIVTPTLF